MRSYSILILLFLPAACMAQATNGYGFFMAGQQRAYGSTAATYGFGGGVDHQFGGAVGGGTDIEGIVPGRGRASQTVGAFSGNIFIHPIKDRKKDIFVTGGYGLIFRDFAANGFNFGAGWNYWAGEHTALRIEGRIFRAYRAAPGPVAETWSTWWGIRVGLTFGTPYLH
jgi:hypothetical protein